MIREQGVKNRKCVKEKWLQKKKLKLRKRKDIKDTSNLLDKLEKQSATKAVNPSLCRN